jgi:aspartate-semialdehyde dehydrogenase
VGDAARVLRGVEGREKVAAVRKTGRSTVWWTLAGPNPATAALTTYLARVHGDHEEVQAVIAFSYQAICSGTAQLFGPSLPMLTTVSRWQS